ncbi:NrsF family protein [Chrysiogenes arsenatis]|uniref:NrsF family protein n=1 Tax=Chrysiogenes arsenatis TaxID=309797 RepID=UPI0004040D5B|nr:DUF1109 domain-containing protein [Chrysiogenes arsenatis]
MRTDDLIAQLAAAGARPPLPSPAKTITYWVGGLGLYFLVLIFWHGARPDLAEKLQQTLFWGELTIMLAITTSALWVAGWLALPDGVDSRWKRLLPLLPLILLAGTLLYATTAPDALSLSECLRNHHFDCLARVLLYAILPALWMTVAIRRGAPTKPRWAGAMIGLAATSGGYILLRITEASDDPTQLIVWHFFPVILLTLLGGAFGRSLFAAVWKKKNHKIP